MAVISNAELRVRVEVAIEDQRRLQDEIMRLSSDNEQLREMLLALVLAIESGGRNRLGESIHELGKLVNTLGGTTPSGDEPPPEKAAMLLREHPEEANAAEAHTARLVKIEREALSMPDRSPAADAQLSQVFSGMEHSGRRPVPPPT